MNLVDQLFAGAKAGASLEIPESWGQGRTAFGGLSAAILNRAMNIEMPDHRHMRVQNVQFVGPLLTETPFQIELTHLRDGKNVSQIQAQLIQNERVAVQAMAAFGRDRASKLNRPAERCELPEIPKRATWIPQIPKVTPKFMQHVDMKVISGGFPFTGRKKDVYAGWMRFAKAPEKIFDAHLITLIDSWPPTVLQQLRWPAPASTLSWNVEFIHPHPQILPTDWLSYECQTRQAAQGYAHTEANIYTPDGTLIAISRQVVTIFD